MKKRIWSGACVVGILALLLLLSEYVVFPIGLAAFAMIAVFEMMRVMGVHKKLAVAAPVYLFTPVFPILAFFIDAEKPESRMQFILIMAAAVFVFMMLFMAISVFSKGKLPFSKSAEVFVGIIYITVSFTSLVVVRYVNDYGYLFLILAFLIPWISDVFAFLIGSAMGKHKLIPEVSPKKSVEGAVAGVLFTVIFCLLYGFIVSLILKNIAVNYIALAVYGLILAVVSQLGDLIASVIKREHGAKDYGKLFPGHGGVMDRFDSVLAISTILLILCLVFPPFEVVV